MNIDITHQILSFFNNVADLTNDYVDRIELEPIRLYGNFYITGNENTAAQPSKVMGGPAPSALTSLMKGRKSVIYGNVARLKDMAAMSGENSRDLKAFDAIFDKVQYVTLSYK